ncbi:SHOCT domain-containing protein [Salinigranum sp. GCM10025319]|uniref:SHOCT domain-containing protein n=1 Tax=Salinigranum sp. GCM10025319 TaxID=3252687 RepID=UPI00361EE03D
MVDTLGVLLQWGPHPGPHGPHAPMGPGGGAGMGGAMPWGTAGTGFGLVWPLLLLGLVVAAFVVGVYLLRRLDAEGTVDSDALTVLRGRYARGEIDDEEFQRRRARLEGSTGS